MALDRLSKGFRTSASAFGIAVAIALGAPTSAPAQGPSDEEYQKLYSLDAEAKRLDRLHVDAAWRCDLAKMSSLQAELDDLVRLARLIAQAARTGSARRTAERFAERIQIIADQARARKPNCPEETKQKTDVGGAGTGTTDMSNQSTPPASSALRVLQDIERDARKVDGRHFEAAMRCDREAMATYLRQLNGLSGQARAVLRNAGLENGRSGEAEQAGRIAAGIQAIADHAGARQPRNCGDQKQKQPGGETSETLETGRTDGMTGGVDSTPDAGGGTRGTIGSTGTTGTSTDSPPPEEQPDGGKSV